LQLVARPPLLIPTDEVYASQWLFEPVDGPNNYQFFVHWSPEFDPEIDRSLTLVGYQVNDLESFTGADAANQLTADALVTHAERALGEVDFDATSDCDSFGSLEGTLVCPYGVGQPEPLVIMSRTVTTSIGEAVLLVPGVPDSAEPYLSGQFEETAPTDASKLLR